MFILPTLFYFLDILFHVGPLNPRSSGQKRQSHRTDGVTDTDDVSGENSKFYPEDFQDYLNNEWGFMRRERYDVKKPGPRLDAKVLKILYDNKTVTG